MVLFFILLFIKYVLKIHHTISPKIKIIGTWGGPLKY